jgi:hypothetical protein
LLKLFGLRWGSLLFPYSLFPHPLLYWEIAIAHP